MSLLQSTISKAKNSILTPIQIEYNKVFSSTENLHTSAVKRIVEINQEVHRLEAERYKLEDIVEDTKSTLSILKERK